MWNHAACRYHVVVSATKDIKRGQELLVNYGRNYWDMEHVDRFHRTATAAAAAAAAAEDEDEDEAAIGANA